MNLHALDTNSASSENGGCEPVAIIGFSGRFPGGANSPDLLWETLVSGRDAVGEANGSRWDLGWHNPAADRQDRVYTLSGGYLDQIDTFDAEFFGLSPREAQQIDPQQRLLLELAWEAHENAGIPPRSLAGSDTGVFVGISSNDYASLVGPGWPDAYSNTGSSFSIAANRISYSLDLHGPSLAVDTACSSSAVCIHLACQAIRKGECSTALAGGVNILAHIRPWLGFARASMLSPTGRCKSFDESGDGYVRAEGGGLVLLKRLADAERDGDNILAVILNTGINSDGRTLGLSMPNAKAQEALLRQVYSECGVEPEQVFYVEAHGTGTSVGDPIECGAIGRVLGAPRKDDSRCLIGSVKSNIGHLEPASGIAGLSKVLLALKNRQIPANLHFNTPNPKIEFDAWKLAVVDTPVDLPKTEAPLVFGLNSFGFGGTNAHIVLQEYRAIKPAQAAGESSDLLILNANSEAALRDLASTYVGMLRAPDVDWHTLTAATALCRSPQRHRLALRAPDAGAAADRLAAWLEGGSVPGCATGTAATPRVPTAFVYSGNGPQWWGMGRQLLGENAIFRETVEAVDAVFAPLSGWSLIAEMARPEAESRIALTEVAQPMLFAMQLGLTEAFRAEGIFPDAVLGHSVGEVAAAWASGALSLTQATEVIFHRSREQARTAGLGKMAAIGIDLETAQDTVAGMDGWLEVAASNGPEAVTVAGDAGLLVRLVDQMTAEGKFARVLPLNYPFHTRAMDPIRDGLVSSLAGLRPSQAAIPFVSTVDGVALDGAMLGAEYWFRNVREPVRFHEAVQHLLGEHGIGLFIEIGPHPVLRDYVAQTARADGVPAVALQSLRRPGSSGPEHDGENFATAVAAAHAHGSSRLDDLFTRPASLPSLPLYPWQRARHWRGSVVLPNAFSPITSDHPLLGVRLPATYGHWEVSIDANVNSYLRDHVVQGAILFPAAGYLEQSLTAARLLLGDGVLDVETFEIFRPLALSPQTDPVVQTTVDSRDGSFEIASRRDRDSSDHTVHVRGRISRSEDCEAPLIDLAAIAARTPILVSSDQHYQDSHFRGLEYGPAFQGIRSVRLSDPGAGTREAIAEIEVPGFGEGDLEGYRSHPALFDSCLQATITLISQNDKRSVSTIPVQLDRVRSYAPLTGRLVCHVTITRESLRSCLCDFNIFSPDGRLLLSVEGARCQKVDLKASTISPLTTEWWRPDAGTPCTVSLSPLPGPADLLNAIRDAKQAPAADSDREAEALAGLDRLACLYAVKALHDLRPDGESFTLAEFARQNRLRRETMPYLTRLLGLGESAGHLTKAGNAWCWIDAAGTVAPEPLWADLFARYPRYQAELLLLAQAGEGVVNILRGESKPDLGASLLEQVQDTSPLGAAVNGLTRAAFEAMVAGWPSDRPIRILEIGGGAGGLTSWLLPILPPGRTDYLFSDPSEAAIGRAERRFAGHRFVRCQTVDPLLALDEQGVPKGYFDIVLVSDPCALGRDPGRILEGARPTLAEGGMLLVVKPASSAFDALVRGDRAEVGPGTFTDAGLDDVTVLDDPAVTAGATLFLARVTGKPLQRATAPRESEAYLIIAEDTEGFARQLAQSLVAAGQSAVVQGFPAADQSAEAVARGLEQHQARRIVLLGARASSPDIFATQSRRCLTAVTLVEAMETARQTLDCTLTIVTRGGFPDINGLSAPDPAEAALWGLGRVIGNEHQGLDLRMIDLHAQAEGPEAAAALAAELLRRDEETEVQLASGLRFVNRERVNTPVEEARQARQGAASFALDFVPQGGLDSLHLRELVRTAPGQGQVEIAVKAAGLNFRDVLWCMGMLPEEAVEHGFSGPTIGMECAGEVLRVGEGVTHLVPGDRVVAFASSCFGTHVTTDAKSVERMPDGMAYAAAATIPTTFLTAWYGLDHLARLEAGETILIHGAAGGVGLAAIQIAKLKGARIIGTAGSVQKRRMLELLGVDHVLNSRTLEFADEAMKLTGGVGVDVVLNSLAGEAIVKGLQCLRPFGRFLEIGKRDLYANSKIGLRPFRNNLSYFGIDADTLLIERPALAHRLFGEVIGHLRDGRLNPLPHQVVPISRAAEAFRAMQQSRHVGKLVVSMELDRVEALPVLRARGPVVAGGTYLVTGGLGGFGLETARWLADRGATALALLSRSGAKSEESQAGLAELAAKGVTVHAFAADVSDEAALAGVLDTIRREMPPLVGVIHSAAVIEDAPILSIKADQLERVFQSKMIGALNLHKLTLNDPIDMFVLYSSSSAVVGNPGQGAYVAANLYLDALAMKRRSMGLPGLAIGWGAIRDAGFLTRHGAVADMLKNRTGLDATPAREALGDLERVLAAGSSRVSVARFDLQRLHQMLPAARVPRFVPIVPKGSAILNAEETLGDLLAKLPKSQRRGFVLERILENAARVLGTSASQVNAEQPLADLGLDSLMAVELAGMLERDVGQPIPVMQLLSASSLTAVADLVGQMVGLGKDGDQKAAPQATDASPRPVADAL